MNCRKCMALATLVIRKEYWYCDNCFLTNTNHKFRACLGKSKSLSANENVLICLSSSKSSTALLDLVYSGITLNGTKTLRIKPYFLHIVETTSETGVKNAKTILEQCKKYNFDIYLVNVNEYYSSKIILPEPNTMLTYLDNTNSLKFNVSPTTTHDLLKTIKSHLFLRIAKEINCKFIFTAETTTELARRMLSNIAIGRGSQVENDIGFADNRDTIRILRPMRDITSEEIDYFIKVKNLTPICNMNTKEVSLQSVIDNFVLDLQENYPSTITTICKTADKIGGTEQNINEKICILCQSNMVSKNDKINAVEATLISRQMCFRKSDENTIIESPQIDNENEKSIFPCIYETLCYSCSRNYAEINFNNKLDIISEQ